MRNTEQPNGHKPNHPAAELFPLLDDAELQELATDIQTNGLHEAIVLHEGKILDGRNRLHACKHAGVEPRFEEYRGTDPISYVLSKNLHRRHLTTSQRSMVAAGIATMCQGQRTDLEPCRNSDKVIGQAEAAKLLKVSRDSVVQATKVRNHASNDINEKVNRAEMSVNAAVGTIDKVKLATPASKKSTQAKKATIGEIAEDPELKAHLNRIGKITSKEFRDAIEDGTLKLSVKDVKLLAEQDEEKIKAARRLIGDHRWNVTNALSFLDEMPKSSHRIEKLVWLTQAQGEWEGTIDGVHFILKATRRK